MCYASIINKLKCKPHPLIISNTQWNMYLCIIANELEKYADLAMSTLWQNITVESDHEMRARSLTTWLWVRHIISLCDWILLVWSWSVWFTVNKSSITAFTYSGKDWSTESECTHLHALSLSLSIIYKYSDDVLFLFFFSYLIYLVMIVWALLQQMDSQSF